jgi:hypothetical protein
VTYIHAAAEHAAEADDMHPCMHACIHTQAQSIYTQVRACVRACMLGFLQYCAFYRSPHPTELNETLRASSVPVRGDGERSIERGLYYWTLSVISASCAAARACRSKNWLALKATTTTTHRGRRAPGPSDQIVHRI